jgi:hypothetical protein
MSKHAIMVEVNRQGRRYEAEARVDVAADPATVWETITDYDGLHEFMPGIQSSRVLERSGAEGGSEQLVVEQHGEFRFLLFKQLLTVRLEIAHEARRIAHARAVRFDLGLLKGRALDTFEGRYELQQQGKSVRLRYQALIVSRFPPPPGIGTAAVRQNLQAQLAAVAGEITRRRQTKPAARKR